MTELEQFVFLCVKQAHQRFCQSSVKQAITEFAFTFLQSFFFSPWDMQLPSVNKMPALFLEWGEENVWCFPYLYDAKYFWKNSVAVKNIIPKK